MSTDVLGRSIPSGRAYQKFEAHFGVDATLPSWIRAGVGTASINSVAASAGSARSTTAATNGSVANLETAIMWEASKLKEIALTVNSLECNTDNLIELSIRLDGGSTGVSVTQNSVESTASFRGVAAGAAGATLFVPFQFPLRGGGATGNRRDLTLRWKIATQEVFLEMDGEVFGYAKIPTLVTTGQIRPLINITTKQASAAWIQCHSFIVETWAN